MSSTFCGGSSWTIRTGTGLWWRTWWLTLPRTAARTVPRPREPMTTTSCRPSSIRLRIAWRICCSVRIVLTEMSTGTPSAAARRIRSASPSSAGPSAAAAPEASAIIAPVRGSAAPVMIVRRALDACARSIASVSARSACAEPSTATRMLWKIAAPPRSAARVRAVPDGGGVRWPLHPGERAAERARPGVDDDDVCRRMARDARGDVRGDRELAAVGTDDDGARAELCRAPKDLPRDVGVRAVALEQLAGDRRPGLAQLGDAGVEERPRLGGRL